MPRVRVSTTVDADLIDRARALGAGRNDAALLDAALQALLTAHRSAEVDAAYVAAYADHPAAEADEWGDLASFRRAAGRS